MLVILFSLKTMESLENGFQPHSGVTPLFSIQLPASLRSYRSIDANTWCKRALTSVVTNFLNIDATLTVSRFTVWLESCPGEVARFEGKMGAFISGKIDPPLKGVKIAITDDTTQKIVLNIDTNDKGSYRYSDDNVYRAIEIKVCKFQNTFQESTIVEALHLR